MIKTARPLTGVVVHRPAPSLRRRRRHARRGRGAASGWVGDPQRGHRQYAAAGLVRRRPPRPRRQHEHAHLAAAAAGRTTLRRIRPGQCSPARRPPDRSDRSARAVRRGARALCT